MTVLYKSEEKRASRELNVDINNFARCSMRTHTPALDCIRPLLSSYAKQTGITIETVLKMEDHVKIHQHLESIITSEEEKTGHTIQLMNAARTHPKLLMNIHFIDNRTIKHRKLSKIPITI